MFARVVVNSVRVHVGAIDGTPKLDNFITKTLPLRIKVQTSLETLFAVRNVPETFGVSKREKGRDHSAHSGEESRSNCFWLLKKARLLSCP
jgi:hypothetical protein